MTRSFDIEHYAHPHDSPPNVLWRVTHYNSQSHRDTVTGELCAASDSVISDEEQLKAAAADHFNWSCKKASQFLSAFADELHACNWARQRGESSSIYITRVITARLPPDVYCFKASTLCEKLGIEHQYPEDEFVFLHRIPWQALGRMRDLQGQPQDSDTNPMIKLIGEANDAFAKHITSTEDLRASDPSSIADAVRNLSRVMRGHHQACIRAMAEVIVEVQRGRKPEKKVDLGTRDRFSEAYRLLHPPPRMKYVGFVDEPHDNPSSLEVVLDEMAETPGSQPVDQLEGVGKRTAAVSSSPAEEPDIPDVGRLALREEEQSSSG
jgi:hypothetical protein